ncbi:F0F1 ATP synthase subunit delta [Ornithinibacillus halophilus]|uniref:ATP synthase subunit delta n=1 Tax=Ornithinibacillus halophilus TaxID=930117 RepID=A0A1M5LWV0_9BACI|nr:F0F1 ATP synthase subunit delta [Ornithinibacillus halophilus]SHG69129.1 ATP synthase F1 subcomplex delta subunit [Ornithinibacillus halophilus]
MSEAVVAKRYADALFQLGNEKDTLDQLVEEFRVVNQVFKENKDLNTFLMHPRVNNAKKKQFVEEVFQGMSNDVVNTMKLLVERQRTDIATSVIDHFIQLVNDAKGIAQAVVYSVRELSDTERKELETTFAKRFNKNAIEIENVVDPSILGGIKIRMGNTILDGTISGKLRRIERNLKLANN